MVRVLNCVWLPHTCPKQQQLAQVMQGQNPGAGDEDAETEGDETEGNETEANDDETDYEMEEDADAELHFMRQGSMLLLRGSVLERQMQFLSAHYLLHAVASDEAPHHALMADEAEDDDDYNADHEME